MTTTNSQLPNNAFVSLNVTDKQMLAWLIANSTLVAYPGTKPPRVAQGFAVIFEVPATAEHSNDLLSVLAAAATHSTTT